jgi:serine/threonine-protein kinase
LFESLIDADVDTRRARLAALELSEPDSRRLAALLDADATADSVMPGSAESLFERIGANGDLSGQLIGTQLGTFTLIERIGEGGSSIVFKAERPVADTTQFAAIKLLIRPSEV